MKQIYVGQCCFQIWVICSTFQLPVSLWTCISNFIHIMEFRSPIKPSSKSKSKLSKSVTIGKHSKYKQQSESKNNAAYVKDISDRPPYKNILNKLLRSENLGKFVREAEKYVELSEEVVGEFKSDNKENARSRNESYQYGKVLLKDGSFVRYYCKLVEKQFPERKQSIRQLFFEKYRNQISLRQKMFFDYFKEECNTEDSISFSFSKSKGKQKKQNKSISQKKAKTEASFVTKENDKPIEILTTIEHFQSSNSLLQTKKEGEGLTERSQKKRKVVHFEKEEQVEQQQAVEESYYSPHIQYKRKETEEEREMRLSGIVTGSKLKSNEKRRSNIIQFQDSLKSNKRLQEIYQQVLKEKEERKKLSLTIDTKKISESTQPVIRKTIDFDKKLSEAYETRIKEFTNEQRQKLSTVQKEIIGHYPNINLKANKKGIQVSAVRVQGHYKGYIIKKALMTDILHYRQPEYIGIIVEKNGTPSPDLKQCEFQEDQRIVAVLFD